MGGKRRRQHDGPVPAAVLEQEQRQRLAWIIRELRDNGIEAKEQHILVRLITVEDVNSRQQRDISSNARQIQALDRLLEKFLSEHRELHVAFEEFEDSRCNIFNRAWENCTKECEDEGVCSHKLLACDAESDVIQSHRETCRKLSQRIAELEFKETRLRSRTRITGVGVKGGLDEYGAAIAKFRDLAFEYEDISLLCLGTQRRSTLPIKKKRLSGLAARLRRKVADDKAAENRLRSIK